MAAIPSTVERVPLHTAPEDNQRIWRQTEMNVAHYTQLGDEAINRRLQALEEEWDIERVLEANAASVVLIGLMLGATVDRRLFILPALVAGFLLQHAVQGWCPPISLFRRLGVRTATEIDEERYALKALRGDFGNLSGSSNGEHGARQAIAAVRR
ncbi:MAG: YgaP-like transmembrane domain [Pirellulaceae bacterium]